MKKLTQLGVFLIIAFMVFGCGKKVKRIDVEKQVDLSGKWNDTDSRLVSEEMIKDCLKRPWIDNFQSRTGKIPTVIVGTVVNKTNEHIISETFTKDLEKAFINSGRVQMVASSSEREEVRAERSDMQKFSSKETKKDFKEEYASDYMLKGVINAIQDKRGKKKIMFYQINLELIDTESNMKVWIGDKKIKKFLK